jgi:hypothetical protein
MTASTPSVASLGGAPKHPVWYHNSRPTRTSSSRTKSTKREYLAREVTGAREGRVVGSASAVGGRGRTTRKYQAERPNREIPVFVLDPIDDAPFALRPVLAR